MRWKFGKESNTPYWLQFFIITATLGVCVPMARSQSFSPFSDFQGLSPTQLTTLQVKLTFTGPQEKPIQTVAFTSTGNTLDLSKFVPFQRPGIPYGNDEGNVRSFKVSVAELQSMIQGVAQTKDSKRFLTLLIRELFFRHFVLLLTEIPQRCKQ